MFKKIIGVPTNNYRPGPDFLEIDSDNNIYTIISRHSGVIDFTKFDESGVELWNKILTNGDGYIIDFELDKNNSSWIIYSYKSKIFLGMWDSEGHNDWLNCYDDLSKFDYVNMVNCENDNGISKIIELTESPNDQETLMQVGQDGEVNWTTNIEWINYNRAYNLASGISASSDTLVLINSYFMYLVNSYNGEILRQTEHKIELLVNEFNSEEKFVGINIVDSIYVISTRRLITFTLDLKYSSEKMLPIEGCYACHNIVNTQDFLLFNKEGQVYYSDYSLKNDLLIDNSTSISIDNYDNMTFKLDGIYGRLAPPGFMDEEMFGFSGHLFRPSLRSNLSPRQYGSTLPVAVLYNKKNLILGTEILYEEKEKRIVVWPNPLFVSRGNLEFHVKSVAPFSKITMYSISGSLVKTRNVIWSGKDQIIKVRLPVNISPGIYIIKIQHESNISAQKILIN